MLIYGKRPVERFDSTKILDLELSDPHDEAFPPSEAVVSVGAPFSTRDLAGSSETISSIIEQRLRVLKAKLFAERAADTVGMTNPIRKRVRFHGLVRIPTGRRAIAGRDGKPC